MKLRIGSRHLPSYTCHYVSFGLIADGPVRENVYTYETRLRCGYGDSAAVTRAIPLLIVKA